MLTYILALLLTVLSPITAQAVTLMSEDFESDCATISARWPDQSYTGFPCSGAMTLNTNPAFVHSGSKSLKFTYEGGEIYGGYVDHHWSNRTYSEIWVTYDTYMVAPFYTGGDTAHGVGGIGTKGLYVFMYSAAQDRYWGWVPNWIWGGKQHTLGTQGCTQNDNGIPYDSTFFYQNQTAYHQQENMWVRHEVHYKLNTPGSSDGLLEEYQTPSGGALAGQRILTTRYLNRGCLDATTGGQMPSDAKWGMIRLYRQYGLGTIYVDNVSVTTEAVGSGTPPPPGDTTAPPIPLAPTVTAQTLPLSVNWTGVTNTAGDLAGYKYYRKLEACSTGTTLTLIATLGNVLTYTDAAIVNTTTNVCLKVSSYDSSGNESSQSAGLDVSLTPPAASVRNTTVTDTFSAGNSNPLPSPWVGGYILNGTSPDVNFQVLSGTAAPSSVGADATMTRNESTPNDQWACEEFTTLGADYPGILLRFAAPPVKSGYEFRRIADGTVRISKWTNGTRSDIQTVSGTFVSNDTLCGEAEGTALRLYKTSGGISTLMHSVVDSTYASGYRGFMTYNATVNSTLVTAFTGGDFDAGASTDDVFANVATLTADETGADVTFTGLAHKIRYWNDLNPVETPVEITGLGGVTTYRITATWGAGVTYLCTEAQGSDGVWETVRLAGSYICDGVPAPTGDVTAPDAPTGMSVR